MIKPREPQRSAATWQADEVLEDRSWEIELTRAQRDEVARAAERWRWIGKTPETLTRGEARLPTLAADLERWEHSLARGRGFVLVHGFPVDLLDDEATRLALVGLGMHFGTPVGRNRCGSILTDIRDERLPESAQNDRIYKTSGGLDFHSDWADLVALLCLRPAASGGTSRIVSSHAIYDHMLATRPDLLEVLYRPFYWDRPGADPQREEPWFTLAPIADVDASPRVFYLGWYIRDAQHHPGVPQLSDEQLEAMELLENLTRDPDFQLTMDFEPGDLQWLNNGRILHARDPYSDFEEPLLRRHLLRLWIAGARFSVFEDPLRIGIDTPQT